MKKVQIVTTFEMVEGETLEQAGVRFAKSLCESLQKVTGDDTLDPKFRLTLIATFGYGLDRAAERIVQSLAFAHEMAILIDETDHPSA